MYNPFEKPLGSELTAEDLQLLVTKKVAEGFYVEYKSQFPASKKIERSISSFANTYGGWYFVGIETDEYNQATNLCGFPNDQTNDPIAKIINPYPSLDNLMAFSLSLIS